MGAALLRRAALLRQRDLLTASLMGFTAGYTTSNTKVRFNTFGGMMTGASKRRALIFTRCQQTPPSRARARTR